MDRCSKCRTLLLSTAPARVARLKRCGARDVLRASRLRYSPSPLPTALQAPFVNPTSMTLGYPWLRRFRRRRTMQHRPCRGYRSKLLSNQYQHPYQGHRPRRHKQQEQRLEEEWRQLEEERRRRCSKRCLR